MELKNDLSLRDKIKGRSEKVSMERIGQVVDVLGRNLSIPEERLNIARKSQVFFVDREVFYELFLENASRLGIPVIQDRIDSEENTAVSAVFEAMGVSFDDHQEERDRLEKLYFDRMVANRGISICISPEEKYIFLNRDEVADESEDFTLSHELLHSMVDLPEGGGGFNDIDGSFHFLNEAVVQVLTLRSFNVETDWQEIKRVIMDGGFDNVPYAGEMKVLISVLEATKISGNEFRFEELKKMYFDSISFSSPKEKAIFLKLVLFSKIKDDVLGRPDSKNELVQVFEKKLEGSKVE